LEERASSDNARLGQSLLRRGRKEEEIDDKKTVGRTKDRNTTTTAKNVVEIENDDNFRVDHY